MRTLAVVNAIGLSSCVDKKIRGNFSSLSMSLKFAEKLPDVEKVILFTERVTGGAAGGGRDFGGYETIRKDSWPVDEFLKTLRDESKGFDHIFYWYADCPLLDDGITMRMFGNHKKYFAEYTFADGYPYGIAPEILRQSILSPLITLAGGDMTPVGRDTLFSIIQKDINAFDLETEISPEDMRSLRISLTADTLRNYLQLKGIIDSGAEDESSILRILKERSDLFRTRPVYIDLQIVDGCLQSCSYCPYPKIGGDILQKRNEMAVKDVAIIAEKVVDFCDDGVIGVSLWGEPSLHSGIALIIKTVLAHKSLTMVIETSGLGWKEETLKAIQAVADDRLTWIVSLDANTPGLYQELRGEGFKEATNTTLRLLELFPGQVYPQAVRMKRNEGHLEEFYRFWKEKTEDVIIQKHDHFSGFLPVEKVTDLSPLKRYPCWHLKRDLYVLLSGEVPLCREDLKGDHILGNILKEKIEDIWERGAGFYDAHRKKEYPEICRNCDEYYTYNF